MPLLDHVRRCVHVAQTFSLRLQPVAPLITRLVIGYAFFRAGLGKLQHYDRTVEFFAGIGIPFASVNAAFIGTLEVVGGAMLVSGLGRRLFAALLSATMLVALATADRERFVSAFTSGEHGLTDVVPLVFLLFLGWLVAYGAGSVSVDHLITRLRRRNAVGTSFLSGRV